MSDIFTKPDPKKDFTKDTSPLDEVNKDEPKESLDRGETSVPWGWYPFLYESPFTAARVPGGLQGFEFSEWGGFPSLGWLSLSTGSGEGELGGGGGAVTLEDLLHEVAIQSCPTNEAGVTVAISENDDSQDLCYSVLDGCQFLNYAQAIEDAFATQYAGDDTQDGWDDFITKSALDFDLIAPPDCGHTYRVEVLAGNPTSATVQYELNLYKDGSGTAATSAGGISGGSRLTAASIATTNSNFWAGVQTVLDGDGCGSCTV